MKLKRSLVLEQGQQELYKVVQAKNTTDYSIGSRIKQKDVDAIILDGVEVIIKGQK